jgi:polysaccharide biosynthesis protein PslH
MAQPVSNGRPAGLFIAPIMPSDRGNGLAMRTGFLLDVYAKRFAIDLAVVPLAGGTRELGPFVAQRTRRAIVLPVAAPDTHFTLISAIADPKVRLAAFLQYARPSIAARLDANIERALLAFAGDASYALVHVSRLYLACLAGAWMEAGGRQHCLVLDCDEDDASAHRRLARLYRKRGRDGQADWANLEADAFRRLAGQWLPRFDLLLTASSGDARLLGTHFDGVAAMVVPNVLRATANYPALPRSVGSRRDILFVGNMSYPPNADAAMWFALRIWPRLRSAVPFPLRFVIAGAGPPREVAALARHPGIVVADRVDDVAPLYRRAALAVVPIRAGGGTRIKLIESANYGVPIVATRFGAAGTGFRSGHELLLADNEWDFAASCARLLTDFRLASRLVAGARRRLLRDYDAPRWAERLLGRIERQSWNGSKYEDRDLVESGGS